MSSLQCTSIDVDDHCARDGFFCSTSAYSPHAQPDFDRSAQTFPTNHSLSHSASFVSSPLPFCRLRLRSALSKVSQQQPSRNQTVQRLRTFRLCSSYTTIRVNSINLSAFIKKKKKQTRKFKAAASQENPPLVIQEIMATQNNGASWLPMGDVY
jgi:hypothetical protein